MKYDPEGQTLSLEKKDCTTCTHGAGGPGQYTGKKTCAKCQGTGKGPRGKVRGCRPCFGRGQENDFDNPVVCPTCHGAYTDFATETFCDRAPQEAVASMPIHVVRLARRNSMNENLLGAGCLWSCQDYGTAAESDDEFVLAKVREELQRGTQATKVVKAYQRGDTVATLHDALVVAVTRDGYSVRAMSDLPEAVTV